VTQRAVRHSGRGPRVPGVILEVVRRRATVLAEGRFLRVSAMPGWEEGAEVWVALPAKGGSASRWRRIVLAVAGAAVVGGSGAFILAGVVSAAQVAAVVSVDINPSVELRVNGGGIVLAATAMDADARRILAPGGLLHQPLSDAITLIVQRAVDDGFLPAQAPTTVLTAPPVGEMPSGGMTPPARGTASRTTVGPAAASAPPVGAIVVTVAPAQKGETALPPAVARGVAAAPADVSALLARHKVQATLDVVAGNQTLVREAKSSRLSLGQQAVYETVKSAGARVDASTFRRESLGKALSAAGVPKADVPTVLDALSKEGADGSKLIPVMQAALHGDGPQALQKMLDGAGAHAEPPEASRAGSAAQGGGTAGAVAGQGNPGGARTPGAVDAGRGSGAGGRSSATGAGVSVAPVATAARSGGRTASGGSGDAAKPGSGGGLPPGLLQRLETWFGSRPATSGDSGHSDNKTKQRQNKRDGGGSGGTGAAGGSGAPRIPAGRPPGDQAAAHPTTTAVPTRAGGAGSPSGFSVPGGSAGRGGRSAGRAGDGRGQTRGAPPAVKQARTSDRGTARGSAGRTSRGA